MKRTKRLRIGLHRILIAWGVDTRKKRPDRVYLERVLFPELLRNKQYQRILFVGVAWYTLHYANLFRQRDFITIEIDPNEAPYGSTRHIVDSCEKVTEYLEPDSVDVIVFNGIIGFGLNDPAVANNTLSAFYTVLKPGGLFILGWNDTPQTKPFHPHSLENLSRFRPYSMPPSGAEWVQSDGNNGHRFEFYIKPLER